VVKHFACGAEMQIKNLIDIIKINIAQYGDKKILLSNSTQLSYSELDDYSEKISLFLKNSGLTDCEFVGVLGLNSPEFVAISFGIWKAGGVLIPFNYSLKPEEIIAIFKKTKLRYLFIENKFLGIEQFRVTIYQSISNVIIIDNKSNLKADNIANSDINNRVIITRFSEIIAKPIDKNRAGNIEISGATTALCIFTSGTTGVPKGVMLTHNNLLANIESMRHALKFQENKDIVLNILPMFHVFSFTCGILLELYQSAPVYIIEKFAPKLTLETIEREKITIILAVPVMLKLLILTQAKEHFDTSSLAVVISGGAALDSETFDNFKKTFGLNIHEGYGITETAPVCALNPINATPVKNSIGKPLVNVMLRIVDEQGNDCPAGVKGELWIKGGNVMTGYYNEPELTASVFAEGGWYKSGDIAQTDEAGNYYIVDRLKDMIIVNGLNVYPAEIEKHINMFDGVAESAVVGISDKRHGEKIIAFIVINKQKINTDQAGTWDANPTNSNLSNISANNFDKNKLTEYLKTRIAHYKVPDKIMILNELPKSPIGKILKKDLRKYAENN